MRKRIHQVTSDIPQRKPEIYVAPFKLDSVMKYAVEIRVVSVEEEDENKDGSAVLEIRIGNEKPERYTLKFEDVFYGHVTTVVNVDGVYPK